MTDEQIVEAAKSAEKQTEFGELVHSKVSRGVNSAYGIGFLEGAEWARRQMKDLTWQDIKRIVKIADDLLENNPRPRSEEEYYTRVLEEFNLQNTKG